MAYKFEERPYTEIFLDDQNPRLPKHFRGKSEEEILEYMLIDGSLIELMLAIGTNGYFPGEQLLVVPRTNGGFKVVEGNRRLSAVKLLNQPKMIKGNSKLEQVIEETKNGFRPTNIPVLIFDEEKEIHDYLGYRHITGIKEWKLLQKARYLSGLFKTNHSSESIDSASRILAKVIGSNKPYVKRLLVGFEIYEIIEANQFFNIPELGEDSFHFNYIADSLNRDNIRAFINVDMNADNPLSNLNLTNLEKLINWFFRRVFPKPEGYTSKHTKLIADSSSLGDLDMVLGNERSYKAFVVDDRNLYESVQLAGKLDKSFSDLIDSALDRLTQADRIIINVETYEGDFEEKMADIIATARKIKRYKEDQDDED